MDLTSVSKIINGPQRRQAATLSAAATANLELNSAAADSGSYIIKPPKDNGLFKSKVSRTQELKNLGVAIKEDLSIIGSYTAELTDKQVKEMRKRGYTIISDAPDKFLPDIPFHESDFETDELELTKIKATPKYKERPQMTEARFPGRYSERFTGKGVTIAVIDTGIYPHPAIADRLLGQVDFVDGRPALAYDDNGHGTHVAGDAAGNGFINENFAGPAKEANLFSLRVLGKDGSGKTSNIIKALQFCIENKDTLGIRVVNMSLGHTAQKDWEEDPVNQAVKAAHEAGLVVLAAAGNEGPDRKTIAAPGDSEYAITIGAADDNNTNDPSDDTMADFSSRGPTLDGRTKPDLVAPGVSIMAPMAPMTSKEAMSKQFQLLHETVKYYAGVPHDQLKSMPPSALQIIGLAPATVAKIQESEEEAEKQFNRLLNATSRLPLDETGLYQGMPGTSMATPIVAGVVAQMLEANPDLTPDEVKQILKETADPLPDGRLKGNSQGAGMVDPDEAIRRAFEWESDADKLAKDPEELLKELEAQGGVLLDFGKKS